MVRTVRIAFHPSALIITSVALLVCTPTAILRAAEPAAAGANAGLPREILDTAGGLVVYFGGGDTNLALAPRARDRLLLYRLETTPEDVLRVRQQLAERGLNGNATVDLFDGRHLPLVDNLANLIVVEDLGDVSMAEVMRVVAPLGAAYVRQNGNWVKTVKPWPEEIDQWSHYLHGPDNNAVADDTVVAPPTGLQWVGGPLWSLAHSTLNGTSCMVSVQGRIFTIEDLGPIDMPLMPGKYTLVARDAFNGIVLWKCTLESWERITYWMKPTPVQLSRRLVAVADRVYATLGIEAPVSVLDAATGEVVKVYDATARTQEIVVVDGVLYVVCGDRMNPYGLSVERPGYRPQYAVFGEEHYSPRRMPKEQSEFAIVAVDLKTGDTLWKRSGSDTDGYQATTLAVLGDMLVYQTTGQLICVDRATGKAVWAKDAPVTMTGDFKIAGASPTLVVTEEVILRADSEDLIAFSAADGAELWRTSTSTTYFSSPDIFVVGDVVWPYPSLSGHNLRTGDVVASRRLTRDGPMGHDRCYRNKATVHYMINSRSGGADYSEFDADFSLAHPWVRGTCSLGIMPCNGLLYASPHACSCVNQTKLNGFYAVSDRAYDERQKNVVERGGQADALVGVSAKKATADDWPMHRHDAARSGNATTHVPGEVTRRWAFDIAGPTAPVVTASRVLVAAKDAHTIYSLDAGDGELKWQFTAGGRIDSPPAYANARVLFGSADGWLYCLDADTGKLAWRFRAAPQARKTVAFGQIESLWPVHGSVLVLDDTVYCTAGRQSFLNGGIYLFGLDVDTGKVKCETCIAGPYGDDGESILPGKEGTKGGVSRQIRGNMSDLLLSDGERIYLRHMAFTRDLTPCEQAGDHLLTVSGFLDASGHHRSYWTMAEHLFYDTTLRGNVDADLLVVQGDRLFGTRIRASNRGPTLFDPRERGFTLFAMTKNAKKAAEPPVAKSAVRKSKRKLARRGGNAVAKLAYRTDWDVGVPVNVRAMVKAGDLLFLAGTPNKYPQEDIYQAVEGRAGGVLVVASASDGQVVGKHRLDSPPVWDGLIAANEQLLISLADGEVQCWGAP